MRHRTLCIFERSLSTNFVNEEHLLRSCCCTLRYDRMVGERLERQCAFELEYVLSRQQSLNASFGGRSPPMVLPGRGNNTLLRLHLPLRDEQLTGSWTPCRLEYSKGRLPSSGACPVLWNQWGMVQRLGVVLSFWSSTGIHPMWYHLDLTTVWIPGFQSGRVCPSS